MRKCTKTKREKKRTTEEGFEPSTFGLEVQRAIHCATRPSVVRSSGFLLISDLLVGPWDFGADQHDSGFKLTRYLITT